MQFLVESEGFFSGDSLCVRLMNHLTKHCEKILNSKSLLSSLWKSLIDDHMSVVTIHFFFFFNWSKQVCHQIMINIYHNIVVMHCGGCNVYSHTWNKGAFFVLQVKVMWPGRVVQVPHPVGTMPTAPQQAHPVMAMAMGRVTTLRVRKLLLQVMLEPQGSCCLFPFGRRNNSSRDCHSRLPDMIITFQDIT